MTVDELLDLKYELERKVLELVETIEKNNAVVVSEIKLERTNGNMIYNVFTEIKLQEK